MGERALLVPRARVTSDGAFPIARARDPNMTRGASLSEDCACVAAFILVAIFDSAYEHGELFSA